LRTPEQPDLKTFRCSARIPGAQEIVIQSSGQIVNVEQPEEFNRAVLDFLGSLPRWWEAGMDETKSLCLGPTA
jgi:hypothetical protein